MSTPQFRFPRTWSGWKLLGWLALRRCPRCHSKLSQDWPLYDDGITLYCFPCGGLMLPKGVIQALMWNARAWVRQQQEEQEKQQGGSDGNVESPQ